ncbi:MAG: FAD-dependent oxidoreductase [Alphaproteobacteria bacterium]|nr:FAD-dependent oxidoreductase [Alphaproteobacteria bacterium]
MADHLFAPGFKTDPYWWDAAPRPSVVEAALPASIDVAIVGSGHTGLSAALTLVRAGRSVAILEAEVPGYGASTRNAGYVGRTLYAKYPKLEKTFGAEKAVALTREGVTAHEYIVRLVEQEQLDCRFEYRGRFIAAESQAHYDKMAHEFEALRRVAPMEGHMVSRADQRTEIGSDYYYGGLVLMGTGALHPGLYQSALMDRVAKAGATIFGKTPVTAIRREGTGFEITTSRGRIAARDVIVATNGYTGAPTPHLRRRVIPVAAYMIATEPLGENGVRRLLPTRRTMIDSKTNIFWARPSPDGKSLLFGARTGIDDGDLSRKAILLHGHMTEVYPELANVRMTHCWTGNMGFTFDLLPHAGVVDGVHFATGYCGVGLPMGTWLGHKSALKVLGDKGGRTPFDDLPFPTRPFYNGRPWFLGPLLRYYAWRDRRR